MENVPKLQRQRVILEFSGDLKSSEGVPQGQPRQVEAIVYVASDWEGAPDAYTYICVPEGKNPCARLRVTSREPRRLLFPAQIDPKSYEGASPERKRYLQSANIFETEKEAALASDAMLYKWLAQVYNERDITEMNSSLAKRVTQLETNDVTLRDDAVKAIEKLPQRIITQTAVEAVQNAVIQQLSATIEQLRTDLQTQIDALKRDEGKNA